MCIRDRAYILLFKVPEQATIGGIMSPFYAVSYTHLDVYKRQALGWAPFDDEGRYIEARFGNLSVVSFYIPSGSSGEERQGFKEEVMAWLKPLSLIHI